MINNIIPFLLFPCHTGIHQRQLDPRTYYPESRYLRHTDPRTGIKQIQNN